MSDSPGEPTHELSPAMVATLRWLADDDGRSWRTAGRARVNSLVALRSRKLVWDWVDEGTQVTRWGLTEAGRQALSELG